MKTKKLIGCALALFATAAISSALPLNITVDSNGYFLQDGQEPIGADSLASNAFYGSFQDPVGSVSNDWQSNYDFLEGVLQNWNANRVPSPLPDLTSTGPSLDDVPSIGGGDTFTAVAGYDYVVFHFGGGQANINGNNKKSVIDPEDEVGWWAAWYLGGQSATFQLPQEGDPLEPVGGFSSARYFNGTTTNVPDGGSTFLALGVGLLGLGGVRRFLIKG